MEEMLENQGQVDPHVMELNYEVQALRNKLAHASQVIERLSDERALARINFLFKVLKYRDMFSEETVAKTVEEITNVMFQPDITEGSNE